MGDEMLIACDALGNPKSPVERYKAHSGSGTLHLAFMATYKNLRNQIYIAQRSKERPDLSFEPPFPLFWDVTIAGHYRWEEVNPIFQLQDPRVRIAREFKEELGLSVVLDSIRLVGKFVYNSKDPTYNNNDGLRELEVCYLAIVYGKEEPRPNKTEVAQGKWIEPTKLQEETQEFMRKYVFSMKRDENDVALTQITKGVRFFTPWFLKAQQLFPQIYGFNPPSRKV